MPMWSSRSHKTGKYNLEREGNVHTMLHWLANCEDSVIVSVTVPPSDMCEDFEEYMNVVMHNCPFPICFIAVSYTHLTLPTILLV